VFWCVWTPRFKSPIDAGCRTLPLFPSYHHHLLFFLVSCLASIASFHSDESPPVFEYHTTLPRCAPPSSSFRIRFLGVVAIVCDGPRSSRTFTDSRESFIIEFGAYPTCFTLIPTQTTHALSPTLVADHCQALTKYYLCHWLPVANLSTRTYNYGCTATGPLGNSESLCSLE
jgi:hypothetical protein